MKDSLLEDEQSSTADIAQPTPRQARAEAMNRTADEANRAVDESGKQPIQLPATTPEVPSRQTFFWIMTSARP